jgi:capsular polysaccharide transport system permease protein
MVSAKFEESAVLAEASLGTLRRKAKAQARIVHALMLREMLTRFGRENLGFFWLMGEPLILTLGVIVLWSITNVHASEGGEYGPVPLALTGYTLVTLWRHILSRSVFCFRHNAGLMFHRNVHYIDTLVARSLLEIGGTGLSFLTAYVPLLLFGYVPPLSDPLLVIGGWLFMGWIAFGVGLILAGLSEFSDVAERFVQPLMYITLPLTGLFYMVSWLPDRAQKVVLYSPLVHSMEMLREGVSGTDVDAIWSFNYLINCCLVLTGVGLLVVRKSRKYVRFE